MESQLLELHLAQLNKVWEKSKHNKYSDSKKQDYHSNLGQLVYCLNQEDFSKLKPDQIIERKKMLDFVFKSLEFLDKSTFNQIPFEIVYCLKIALEEWLNPGEDFLIVTSLVNGVIDFSFDPTLIVVSEYYTIIDNVFKIKFSSKLVQINLPVYLSRDYLANVVLYHELGHFIDTKFQITESIYHQILIDYFINKNLDSKQAAELLEYFPYLNDPVYGDAFKKGIRIVMFKSHLAEYFCDIFASQYINNCSGFYLDYITQRQATYASSHPSTVNRNNIVDKFITHKINHYVIKTILEATNKITKRNMEIRFEPYSSDDLKLLLPVEIKNQKQLHFLFVNGWNVWLKQWTEIENINNFQFQLSQGKVYNFINNLIEKSIGNYIISSEWEIAKPHVPRKK